MQILILLIIILGVWTIFIYIFETIINLNLDDNATEDTIA